MSSVFRGRRLIVILAVIIITVGTLFLINPARAINNQNKAGILIAQAMNSNAGMIACEMPLVDDENNRVRAQAAVKLLELAIKYAPSNSQSYLQLGRAYCLLDQPDKAVDAIKTYIQLRPDNPLGHLELGFVEQKQCAEQGGQKVDSVELIPYDSETGLCQRTELIQAIRSEWQAYGMKPEQFLSLARQSFDKKRYADAILWYQRVLKFELMSVDDLPKSDQYKWAVSAILTNSAFPQSLKDNLQIIEISGSTTIKANQLRLLMEITEPMINYGDPIPIKTINQHSAVIFYFNSHAGVFIKVPQDGWYQISMQAQNSPPAPVILQLEDGFQSFGKINLNRGDMSWEVFQFKVFLQSGIHLLDVNFINDELVDGIDRNAIIEWIKVIR